MRSSFAGTSSTRASVLVTSSPEKRGLAREHLVEHAAERPDVGALSTDLPRACSGLM